ncbi:MAG: hypothetical protein GZ094_09340 [Mariniphaga sp.]|nr:hypothetical protein [Mariniphaga sp.]
MKRIVFKNHLSIDMFLYEDVFNSIIEKDSKNTQLLEALEDLFMNADEIYMYDYSGDGTLIAYKYIKFYSDCALFGIVNIMDIMEQEVIDFYRIDGEETITDNGVVVNKIDSERIGQLIKGPN